jgi:prepilin-type N-terminal cleavage/methylation domain-containing protein
MKHAGTGFTLIELMLAIVVLGIGIFALVGASASVTRMIGRGKIETRAAQAASRRMETLRLSASATLPRCTDPDFTSGGPVISGGVMETWQVSPSGKVRQVRVIVTYLTTRGSRTATLETRIPC